MTDPNGWPDASKPGVPLNPEREGAHVLDAGPDRTGERRRIVALWTAGGWLLGVGSRVLARHAANWGWLYVGPCHTPDEVAALIEAAYQAGAEAMRRAAEDETDCGCANRNTVIATMICDGERKARRLCGLDVCLALHAATIRDLPLPKMEDKTND